MSTINTRFALLGRDKQFTPDVTIEYSDSGIISDVVVGQQGGDSSYIAVPAFFNAHVHAADIGIRDQVGTDLHEIVGPGGVKHTYLAALSLEGLTDNIRASIREARHNGVLGYADFREGGLDGREPYETLHTTREFQSFLPLLRPEVPEFANLPTDISVGIRDVTAYSKADMQRLASHIHSNDGVVHIHVSEDEQLRDRWRSETGLSDLEWALDVVTPDALVHATLATADEIESIGQTDTGVVVCPASNRYFDVGVPPVEKFLDAGIPLGIGSDNAMINPVAMWDDVRLLLDWGIDPVDILHMATVGGASLCNLEWGIHPGNSHFLIFDAPSVKESELHRWLLQPQVLDHLVDTIYPVTTQSDN